MIRMSVSILFSCRDDFLDFDQSTEVNWGLGCLEGHGDFGLFEVRLFAIERREDSLEESVAVPDEEHRGDFIFNHWW